MSTNKLAGLASPNKEQSKLFQDNKRIAKKIVTVMKQREIIEQLEKIVIQSDQQNKRLQQQIAKMSQRQKNTTLYYQSKILQLQGTIERQMIRIQTLQTQKLKREPNLNQSKLMKTSINESKKYSFLEQKQNMNTLNSNYQPYNMQECICKDEQIKKCLSQLCEKLDYLLHSLQIRKKQSENELYIRQLQLERQKKRCLLGKDSLLLLNNIHQKMIILQQSIGKISNQLQISDPLLLSFKNINKIQQGLLKIPFLQKINLNERKQELDDILQEAKQTKKRLFSLMINHKNQ